jgi:mRNA interferase MazF
MTAGAALAPWQLWVVDFGDPVGHEQGGTRPAIVVGSAAHCGFHIDMALVVPLTTRDRGLRHHVRIASRSSGLGRPSWARTEEITSVSTLRFGESPIGRAAPGEIAELRQWLSAMVAF